MLLDFSLQYIGNALVNLQTLNVYNDGHVTDDGVGALAGLTALTSLDLQGNVSITHVCVKWFCAPGLGGKVLSAFNPTAPCLHVPQSCLVRHLLDAMPDHLMVPL